MNRILLAVLVLALSMGATAAQDAGITLTPYTDSNYGFKSVAPEGWTTAGPGLLARGNNAADPTLIAQQSAPVSADKVIQALLPQLSLTEAPDSVGTYESDSLNWTLYKVDVEVGTSTIAVDLGLAEAGGKTYIALLQTTPDEYDALHASVFLPVLDALTPYVEKVDVPYQQEEVTFKSGDVTLAGTLTVPEGKGPFAAVVLISGSGPQDRDESIGAMKPLGMVADALTRAGMAVLRYDDRGVGGSGGDIYATLEETTADASAALVYLKGRAEVNYDQMGVLGHSEGGIVAAALGANDPNLDFIIVMAGPAVSGKDILLEQGKLILKAEGGSDEMAALQASLQPAIWEAIAKDDEAGFKKLAEEATVAVLSLMPEDNIKELGDLEAYAQRSVEQQMEGYFNRWFQSFLVSNPAPDWAKTTVPVLAVFGGKDVQVPAAQNAPALEVALQQAGNSDYEIVTLADANHLFQSAETGAITEYATLKAEFTSDFVPTLVEWLQTHVTLQGE